MIDADTLTLPERLNQLFISFVVGDLSPETIKSPSMSLVVGDLSPKVTSLRSLLRLFVVCSLLPITTNGK